MSTEIMLHDYDALTTEVWDKPGQDNPVLGTLKLEVSDVDEVYFSLSFEKKDITFYVSLQLLEAVIKKTKQASPNYSEL